MAFGAVPGHAHLDSVQFLAQVVPILHLVTQDFLLTSNSLLVALQMNRFLFDFRPATEVISFYFLVFRCQLADLSMLIVPLVQTLPHHSLEIVHVAPVRL